MRDGMTCYLIKYGGNSIPEGEALTKICKEIANLKGKGNDVVIVHGGGSEISKEVERMGITPTFIDGIRVTDDQSLVAVEHALRNVNLRFEGNLQRAGAKPIPLPLHEISVCERMKPLVKVQDGKETILDCGHVGEVAIVDRESIDAAIREGIPLIYPCGKDAEGNLLNVNADSAALGVAIGMGCDELIFVSDVPGVLKDIKDPASKFDRLTIKDVDALIESGVVNGGMIPKVKACCNALLAGVNAVRLIPSGSDVSEVGPGSKLGTLFVR